MGKLRKNSGQGADKGNEIVENKEQAKGLLSEEESRLDQTGIFCLPTTDNEQPMLHECQEQFGVHLAQAVIRVLGAPFIEGKLLFPQLEEQLNMPA